MVPLKLLEAVTPLDGNKYLRRDRIKVLLGPIDSELSQYYARAEPFYSNHYQ